jgi:hypothetical protein
MNASVSPAAILRDARRWRAPQDEGGVRGRNRYPVLSNNSRPISMRRISLVPAPIS